VPGQVREAPEQVGTASPANQQRRPKVRRWLRPPLGGIEVALRVVVASGLAVDAYVHANLAHIYAESTGGINEGTLFRFEAVVAAIVAALVVLTATRLVYLAALLVGVSAAALATVATYYQIGPVGPLPNLYDPIWYPEKVLSVVAESVAALGALGALVFMWLTSTKGRRSSSAFLKGGGNGRRGSGRL
jgi:hypothetical protein